MCNSIKLLIFPEATRTKEKTLKQFKKGAFFIAIQNKLPIVPVVFSPYSFVNDETKIFNSGKMIVNILPPIEMDRFGVEDVGKLAGMVQDLMSAEFHRLGQLVSK
ncbi:unnamed protein product [Allacma fusca]|uniref:1-acylglycerol-3-phosphate O-acyltransferase n=1 Tax=Allacma fusca TaxID=39272 RepID=A0A8J2P2U4_9HEXA|nr:unnamed protein product [Allacma fusca]